MDEFTPKTFAVGEILTAQDVNEFLTNTVRRIILRGEEVGTALVGNPVDRQAIVDIDAFGNKNVTWTFRITGNDGVTANTPVFILAPILRSSSYMAVALTSGSNQVLGSTNTSGEVIVRVGSTSSNLGFSGNYPVLAD